MRNGQAYKIEYEIQPKDWFHPAETVKATEQLDEQHIQIYKDGSKSKHGICVGIAIIIQNELPRQNTHSTIAAPTIKPNNCQKSKP